MADGHHFEKKLKNRKPAVFFGAGRGGVFGPCEDAMLELLFTHINKFTFQSKPSSSNSIGAFICGFAA